MIRRPPRSTPFPYPTLSRSSPWNPHRILPRSPTKSSPSSSSLPPLKERVSSNSCGRGGIKPPSYQVNLTKPAPRSEEHTSELQSPDHLVCRLLLVKKKT